MPAYTEQHGLRIDPGERRQREIASWSVQPPPPPFVPNPPLPDGWHPMRTAPKDRRVLLSARRTKSIDAPFVGIGKCVGFSWEVEFDGMEHDAPCEPDGWQEIPSPVRSAPAPYVMPDLRPVTPQQPIEQFAQQHAEQRALAHRAEIAAAVADALARTQGS